MGGSEPLSHCIGHQKNDFAKEMSCFSVIIIYSLVSESLTDFPVVAYVSSAFKSQSNSPRCSYQTNMADSRQCSKLKDNYDECFNSWHQDYYKDKSAAKRNLSVCNELLISYKACIKKVLSDDFDQTPPRMRSIKYR